MQPTDKYNERGVSSQKEDVHKAIANLDKGLFPYAFCKIIPDVLGGDDVYCNIIHADGAGTKSSLAYLYWKETGDLSVWRGIAQDALVMKQAELETALQAKQIPADAVVKSKEIQNQGEDKRNAETNAVKKEIFWVFR
jgi:hypothetical protein